MSYALSSLCVWIVQAALSDKLSLGDGCVKKSVLSIHSLRLYPEGIGEVLLTVGKMCMLMKFSFTYMLLQGFLTSARKPFLFHCEFHKTDLESNFKVSYSLSSICV